MIDDALGLRLQPVHSVSSPLIVNTPDAFNQVSLPRSNGPPGKAVIPVAVMVLHVHRLFPANLPGPAVIYFNGGIYGWRRHKFTKGAVWPQAARATPRGVHNFARAVQTSAHNILGNTLHGMADLGDPSLKQLLAFAINLKTGQKTQIPLQRALVSLQLLPAEARLKSRAGGHRR